MAQQTYVQLVDDLDGTEIVDGEGETVAFGLDGVQYEIDLTEDNAAQLRADLDAYIKAGRRVSGRRSSRGPSASSPRRGARTDREQLQAMRQWGRANGYNVSDRGRVSQELQDAYHAAH